MDPEVAQGEEERRQAVLAAQQRADAAREEVEEAEPTLRQLQLPDQRLPEPEPDLDPGRNEGTKNKEGWQVLLISQMRQHPTAGLTYTETDF